MVAPDAITPAFIGMTKAQTPEMLDLVYHSAERHRLFGGKSARLLRKGDILALRDLYPERIGVRGMATVSSVYGTTAGTTLVITAMHGLFLIPGSRLVIVRRMAA